MHRIFSKACHYQPTVSLKLWAVKLDVNITGSYGTTQLTYNVDSRPYQDKLLHYSRPTGFNTFLHNNAVYNNVVDTFNSYKL
jgi:hypothetical protein